MSDNFVKALVISFALFLFLSVLVISAAFREWQDDINRNVEASIEPRSEIVELPSSKPELLATSTPTSSSPTLTPIVNPYDFGGVRFDSVSEEEVLNGVTFDEKEARVVTFQFTFQDKSYFVVKFLSILDFEWMEDFNAFCPAGSRKGCVYSGGVHLTIKIHSGCLSGRPLAGEPLRVYLEGEYFCDFPKDLPVEEEKRRVENFMNSDVVLLANFGVVPLSVEWVEHVAKERVEEFSRDFDPGYLLSLFENWVADPNERYIILRTSGRERGCEPNYSCDRWIVVLRRKN